MTSYSPPAPAEGRRALANGEKSLPTDGNALLADQGVLTTIESCVRAFAGTPERVLLVTPLPAGLIAKCGGTLARAAVFDGGTFTSPPSCRPMHVDNPAALAALGRFDVVVLDRCSNHPELRRRLEKLWTSERSMVREMRSCLRPQGRLLILDAARRAAALQRALVAFRFSTIESYCLLPGLSPMCHLVSSHPRAMRAFMLRAHGFASDLPRNPLRWPRWLAVYLGADRWHVAWYLFHARP